MLGGLEADVGNKSIGLEALMKYLNCESVHAKPLQYCQEFILGIRFSRETYVCDAFVNNVLICLFN